MPSMGSSAQDYGVLASSLFSLLTLSAVAALGLVVILGITTSLFGVSFKGRFDRFFDGRPWMNEEDLSTSPRAHFIRICFGIIWIIDGLFQLRPDMPGGFVSQVAQPALQGAPSFIVSIANAFLNIWNAHPIRVDLATAWIQLAIGIGLLTLSRGVLRRGILYVTLIWSLIVFVVGNGAGVFYPGAAFVTGAPAAILIYGFAAIYLLGAESGRSWVKDARVVAYFSAAFLLVGGVLQALPSEGYWKPGGLSSMVSQMAQANQPGFASFGVKQFASLASASPVVANSMLVVLPIASALLLYVLPKSKVSVISASVVMFFGWWVGMDFGVFSSTATDFNSGLPFIVLTLSLLRSAEAVAVDRVNVPLEREILEGPFSKIKGFVAGLPLTGLLLSLGIVAVAVFGPTSDAMAQVDSTGVQPLQQKAAPGFSLTNYNGQKVSLSSFRGRPVILTFLDPVCYDSCPLIAQEVVAADSEFGSRASDVALVAVVADPIFHSVSDASAFVTSHGLSKYKNFYYLTGSDAQLRKIWNDYEITVVTPREGMVLHSQMLYFINPKGQEVSVLEDTANPQLTTSYVSLIYKTAQPIVG
jgi:cytochrome oxidase Cu insertion factor (SCO1/SenC/PrrC family)